MWRFSLLTALSAQVIEAGANAIVSGSGVFGAKDYAAAIQVGRRGPQGRQVQGRALHADCISSAAPNRSCGMAGRYHAAVGCAYCREGVGGLGARQPVQVA